MDKGLLAVLNDSERLLVADTEAAALATLDEDATVALHDRIRRARNKYVGQYRRQASARVSQKGGRGVARPKNKRASDKAEVFEEALARVSRRLGVLAAASARELKAQRLEAARAAKAGQPVEVVKKSASKKSTAKDPAKKATAKRGSKRTPGKSKLRTPASEKNRAGTKALGAKRQAKRDSR